MVAVALLLRPDKLHFPLALKVFVMSQNPQLEQLDVLQSVKAMLRELHFALYDLGDMARIPLLYTPDEIRERVRELRQLSEANTAAGLAAIDALDALPEEAKLYKPYAKEPFAIRHGEEEANRIFEPFEAAVNISRESATALEHFRREHPLIVELLSVRLRPTNLLDWSELPPDLQFRVQAVMTALQLPSPCPTAPQALWAWLAQYEPMLATASYLDDAPDDESTNPNNECSSPRH